MSFLASALLRMRRALCFSGFAFLLLGAFCVLAGCRRAEPRADLVIINNAEPGSLDPAMGTGYEELRIILGLWEGLMRVDPRTAQPIPGLAERYDVSPDGLVYTFHLRTNAVWSTGEPITARDVEYSWLRVLAKATGSEYVGQLFYLKNAEPWYNGTIKDRSQLGLHVIDDHTLRVELNHPTAFFPGLCAFQTLAVVPRWIIEKHGDRWLRARPLPVSGPYQLEEWRVNDKVRLRKNPLYWDAKNTHCELIDLLPIGTPSTAFNLYRSGKVDIIWDKELVPPELFATLRDTPDYHGFPYLATYFIRFNTTKKPFDDARVRRAFTMSIDRQRLVDKIIKSGEPVATHLVPPGTANYDAPAGLPYDVPQAKRLLAEAGFPDGRNFPPFEYFFDASAGGAAKVHAKIGVELQEMWQSALGVKAGLRQMEKKVFLKAQSALEYDISRSSWGGDYNDPNTFLDLFLSNNGNNRTGWTNAHYDRLMQQASVLTDLKGRAALLREAETILVREEAPIAPIYFNIGFNYYHPTNVQGLWGNILDVHPLNAIRKGGK